RSCYRSLLSPSNGMAPSSRGRHSRASDMIAPAWLWVVFTIAGATGQSLRNAAQRSLTDTLGTVGATHIRFLFGLPFGLAALAVLVALGSRIPTPNAVSLAWCIFGAVAQIVATALMLAAMQQRSFVVTTAYTKT